MDQARRSFFKVAAATGAATAIGPLGLQADETTPLLPKSKGKRVVVIGGGFGGLSAAKTLRQKDKSIEVVVLEKRPNFISCPYSNGWIGGIVDYEELHHDAFAPAQKYGYKLVQTTVTGIDRAARTVKTANGSVGYDYLILSPGIRYDYAPYFGSDTAKAEAVYQSAPPALQPGNEQLALVRQLRAVKGGNFVIVIPEGVFRCPPAPYERACMVAAWYKKQNIKGKVIVIDPREKPLAKAEGFLHSFKTLYPDTIEYIHSAKFKDIDLDKKIVYAERFNKEKADFEPVSFDYAAANVIPAVRASSLIGEAGLQTHAGGWARLSGPSHRSANDERVYVIGDSQGEFPYPKSGQMANAQAKVAAAHIAARLAGKPLDEFALLPFNVCYSLIGRDPATAIVVFHDVSVQEGKIKVTARDTQVADEATGKATTDWYRGIIADIFL